MSYCGACDVDDVGDGLDELRGLGLVPLVGAAAASPTGQSIIKNVGGAIVGGVTNLFGGGPENEPSGWTTEALSGRVRCPTGGQMLYDYPPGGFRKGQYWGASVDELEAALAQTPRGRPGDPPGTIEGLITALVVPNPSLPRPRDNRELARAAVYIAHGKGDCKIGAQESPAAEHIDAIIQRYRASSATIPSPAQDLASPGDFPEASGPSSPATLPELGEVARRNPLATVGIIAGIAFLASIAVQGR